MPTILYHQTPIIYLRTKKAGSHSVKHCLRKYAEENQVSYLEIRSKPSDTLETHKFVSHMPAKYLAERLDVWESSQKFTFIRNPWEVTYSSYVFSKYTGPQYGWNNPDNYDLRTFDGFLKSLIDIHGTTNFNREIYTIDNKVVSEVYDITEIENVIRKMFGKIEVPKLNAQKYKIEKQDLDLMDKYVYNHYEWEIEKYGYERPPLD